MRGRGLITTTVT